MIVCLCSGLTENQVKTAIQSGCLSPEEIFKFYAITPKCGTCFSMMNSMALREPNNKKEIKDDSVDSFECLKSS